MALAAAAKSGPLAPPDERERFERALERRVEIVLRLVGDAPVAAQLRWHLGLGDGARGRRGKRLRPRLLLAVARQEGARFDDAVDAALAVEFLHNYSLVHDDVEDGDRLRHGRETVWARYGVAHGVNTGDALCAAATLALFEGARARHCERVPAVVRTLQRAALEMAAGQAFDIAFESAVHVAHDAYLAMIEGKTAALFGACCELGALVAGAPPERAAAYREVGRALGRAFQIHDDVSGTWGVPEATGKPRASDIARRKWTYPLVWALAGPASAPRSAIADRYAAGVALGDADVAVVIAALDALGAPAAARRARDAHVLDAHRIADMHGIDPERLVRALCTESVADSL